MYASAVSSFSKVYNALHTCITHKGEDALRLQAMSADKRTDSVDNANDINRTLCKRNSTNFRIIIKETAVNVRTVCISLFKE